MKVLIVEDDKVLSLLLTRMIEKLSLELADTVTKGQEAIAKVKELNPDVILMDIMLEDEIDGIEAMTEIRTFNPKVPVIFITGNSDAYNRKRASKIDYLDYLIKPVTFDELKTSLSKLSA